MPQYRFKAKDGQGKLVTGILEAENTQDARYRIEGRGQKVVEIKPAVLRKPRPQVDMPTKTPVVNKRSVSIVLVILLALAAFYYFDPLMLRQAYGLP